MPMRNKTFLPLFYLWLHSHEKRYQALPTFMVTMFMFQTGDGMSPGHKGRECLISYCNYHF